MSDISYSKFLIKSKFNPKKAKKNTWEAMIR